MGNLINKHQSEYLIANDQDDIGQSSKNSNSKLAKSNIAEEPAHMQQSINPMLSFTKSKWRWVILVLICYLNMIAYYELQIPTVLQDAYTQQNYKMSALLFNIATALYSIPNIIAPLFIGFHTSLVIYTFLMVIGMGIQLWSGYENSYGLLVIGIVIFGIGMNGTLVLMNSFTCRWFKGRELSLAFASINAIQYFGQVICSFSLPPLQTLYNDLSAPFLLSFILQVTSLFAMGCMVLLDRFAIEYDIEHRQFNIILNLYIRVYGLDKEDIEQIYFSDIKKFSILYWLVNASTFIAWGCLQYNNNIQSFLSDEYGLDSTYASYFIAMQFLIQLPLTPLIGYYCDMAGHRSQIFIIGSIINIIQFIVFLALPTCGNNVNPDQCDVTAANYIIPIAIGGIGNSFFGAINSAMVALSVESKYLNTAFGIFDCSMQAGMSITPFIMGALLNLKNTPKDGYQYFFYFSLGLGLLQFGNSVWIYLYDRMNGNRFEQTQNAIASLVSSGASKSAPHSHISKDDIKIMKKSGIQNTKAPLQQASSQIKFVQM